MNLILDKIGLWAAVTMPLWNIPLIVRIVQRGTSKDISLWWVFGVWSNMLLMLPSGLRSTDPVLKSFSISNVVLFSMVVFAVVLYRKKAPMKNF